tara:strand:+ start:27225 stop:28508 length:1284 start_codon:yes stop_codon:yes gene_type:complete
MSKSRNLALKVLNKFNEKKVSYAIMRNWEFLRNRKIQIGKDIDIVTNLTEVELIDKILLAEGFVKEILSPFSGHIGYVKYIPEEIKLLKFHFHVGGVSGRHVVYLDAVPALNRRVKFGKHYVLSKEDLLLTLIIHSPGSKRYASLANSIKNFDKEYLLSGLQLLLGFDFGEKVFDTYLKNFELLDRFREGIRWRIFLNNPLKVIYVYFMSILWYLPQLIRGAPLITFVGMDGAGKSTATANLMDVLKLHKIPSDLVYVGRGKNNVLPIQFFGRRYKKYELKKDKSNKKAGLKKNLIYSLAAPIYYLDFMLRYLKIFVLRRTKRVVITDRFGTDLLLMKYVPNWLRKSLYFLMPKPNLIFYLYSDISKLYSRKPLHPKGDLERQEKLFENILPVLNNVKKIKTINRKQTVNDVSNELFAIWMKYYSKN